MKEKGTDEGRKEGKKEERKGERGGKEGEEGSEERWKEEIHQEHGVTICSHHSIIPRPDGGGPFWPPLWFFLNSEKTAARSAAKFWVPYRASI